MSAQKPKEFIQQVNIKSKYLSSNQQRKIIISPELSQIAISQSGKPDNFKQFHIDQLSSHQIQGNRVTLNFDNGRKYQIISEQPQTINKALVHTKNVKLCNNFIEQTISVAPKNINYLKYISRALPKVAPSTVKINNASPSSSIVKEGTNEIIIREQKKPKPHRQYKRMPYFINPTDWRIVQDKGQLILLNQQWMGNTSKIFAFVLKKFLSTGTFMGISFPVFAMKTQSILQTYAKALGAATNIITNSKDHLERIKQFMCFIWSISLLQVTIVKPFNPVIGQTFQADICGGKYSAEQVSHHPPISAFYYEKDNYKIHASMELSASIGINSGQGRFIGDITIQYDDKYWIKGRLPNGEITGVLFGETTFQTFGGSYIYDSKNLVLTYEINDDYLYEGYLGFLNHQNAKKFQQLLKDNNRFNKFKAFSKDQYTKTFSHVTARYSQWVAFDGKIYHNFNDPKLFPFILQKPLDQYHLKSDSSFRKDIQLLKQKQIQKSQQQKERIQQQERFFRKQRQKYSK